MKTTSITQSLGTLHRSTRISLAAWLTAILLLPSALRAQSIVNGDFETGAGDFVSLPGYLNDGSNPSAIPGWIGGSGINPIASGEAPFMDNGYNPTHAAFVQGWGSLQQAIPGLVPGGQYVLSMDYNARICCDDLPIASISVNGSEVWNSGGPVFPVGGLNPWYQVEIPFTAPALKGPSSTVLDIASRPAAGRDATLLVDNVRITVVIGGCDSGVPNRIVTGDGKSISDLVNECDVSAKNHGDFVSCVAQRLDQLAKQKLITGAQKGLITACAAQSNETRAPTRIRSCPFLITKPGAYILMKDLTCSGTAITIRANDVDLDLNGHTVSGDNSSGNGIAVEGGANVRIHHGTVENFEVGIRLSSTLDNKLGNLVIRQNSVLGIFGEGDIGTSVTSSMAHENGDTGIFFSNSRGTTVTSNTANQNVTGIAFCGAFANTVTGNTANKNVAAGIIFYGECEELANTVTDNTANQNGAGIILRSFSESTVARNRTDGNGTGISLEGDSRLNTVSDNTANENRDLGINFDFSSGNLLTRNTTDRNGSGITLNGDSHENTIEFNSATANRGEGIRLFDGPTRNTVQNNTVTGNGVGIKLFDPGTGVGASRNLIRGNAANLNALGISVEQGSNDNIIENNTANQNHFGIHLRSSNGNMVTANTTDGNSCCGITLDGDSRRNTVAGNTATSNQGEGIRLMDGATENMVQDNTVSGNAVGIKLFIFLGVGASHNTIQSNTATLNMYGGISVEQGCSVNSILGNTALNNQGADLGDQNPACDSNAWINNQFVTDNVAGASDGGPGVGCIQ